MSSALSANAVDIFETPTALSLERGEFHITTHFYQDGGLLLRAGVGASSYFNLGIIEYFDKLIGTETGTPSIPHAYVKVKIPLPSGRLASLDLAFGYDSLYRGNFKPFTEKLYGIYGVLSLGLPWFSQTLLAPHYFSFGVRYPIIFKTDTPDAFLSLYFRFSETIQLATELSNLHLGKTSRYRFINNTALFLFMGYGVSLKTTFQVAGEATGTSITDVEPVIGLAFALSFRNFF